MYKYTHNMLPFANSLKFAVNVDIHSYDTRQRDKIHVTYCHTKVYQMTLLHSGPRLWNDLPSYIKLLPFGTFKQQLKIYLL